MSRQSNCDKHPVVSVGSAAECAAGWRESSRRLAPHLSGSGILTVECYPGVFAQRVCDELKVNFPKASAFFAEECLETPRELRAILDPLLGTDRVIGRMNELSLESYFDAERLREMCAAVRPATESGPVIIVGAGAALVSSDATLVYADMARWELQFRFRRGEVGNLGLNNAGEDFAALYKCGFLAEWRAADRLKKILLPKSIIYSNSSPRRTAKEREERAKQMIQMTSFYRTLCG